MSVYSHAKLFSFELLVFEYERALERGEPWHNKVNKNVESKISMLILP